MTEHPFEPRAGSRLTPGMRRTGRRRPSARVRTPPSPRRLPGLLALGALALALLQASALGAQVAPSPQAISLDEAIAMAMDRNPSVLVPEAEIEASLWNVRAARASLLPSASVSGGVSWQGSGEERLGSLTSGELGLIDQPSWYFSQYNAGLSYSLSGATLLAPREARAGLESARARSTSAANTLRLEVTRAYIEVLRRDEAVRLADSEIERASANLRLAEAQVAVGAATQLDVRQAQIAVGRARVNKTREEGEAGNARIGLLVLLGQEPIGAEGLRLTTSFPLEAPTLDESALIAEALEGNPELAQLRAQEEQARVSVRSAQTAYLPSLNAQAGWSGFTRQASDGQLLIQQAEARVAGQIQQCQFQNELFSRLADPLPPQNCGMLALDQASRDAILAGNQAFPFDFTRQPPSVGLSISIPVFQGLQRQRQIESARVQLRSARLREDDRARSLRGDVARSVTTVRTALATAQLEEENLEVARAQLRLAREQYQAGMVDFLQLADAENILARGEREFLAAVFTVHEALAGLEATVGRPLIQR